MVGSAERLLPAEELAAGEVVSKRLAAEGVRLHLGVKPTKVDGVQKRLTLSDGSALAYDALLVEFGRKVHVDGMGLEAAGVKFSATGVEADDHLQTANHAGESLPLLTLAVMQKMAPSELAAVIHSQLRLRRSNGLPPKPANSRDSFARSRLGQINRKRVRCRVTKEPSHQHQ